LKEVEKPPVLAASGGCWFQAPGVIIHLSIQADFVPARKAHPVFLVKALHAFEQHLIAADIAFTVD
jgi:hypothetical protein